MAAAVVEGVPGEAGGTFVLPLRLGPPCPSAPEAAAAAASGSTGIRLCIIKICSVSSGKKHRNRELTPFQVQFCLSHCTRSMFFYEQPLLITSFCFRRMKTVIWFTHRLSWAPGFYPSDCRDSLIASSISVTSKLLPNTLQASI